MSGTSDGDSAPLTYNLKKQDNQKQQFNRDVIQGGELWTDGLICDFEFVRGHKRTTRLKSNSTQSVHQVAIEASKKQLPRYGPTYTVRSKDDVTNIVVSSSPKESGMSDVVMLDDHSYEQDYHSGRFRDKEKSPGGYWIPIGWARISELVQTVQVDVGCTSQTSELTNDEDNVTVADVAAPYWERPVGVTWWCHVTASHLFINAWFSNAQWLHPAISIALRDESKLISECMKHLLYEVPVRVAGGLLFELLGQSVGDPLVGEGEFPVVLRSWQAQNFLVTALHVKGSPSNINVLGIAEVQELLSAGGCNLSRTIHEVIALLTCRLA